MDSLHCISSGASTGQMEPGYWGQTVQVLEKKFPCSRHYCLEKLLRLKCREEEEAASVVEVDFSLFTWPPIYRCP